jgi:hypothetical protein
MMHVDIEIYMTNFKGFFEKNPEQLKQLIGNLDSDKFFSEIRKQVEKNVSNEKPLEPTRKQIIEILVLLNGGKPVDKKKLSKLPVMSHHMGSICLN